MKINYYYILCIMMINIILILMILFILFLYDCIYKLLINYSFFFVKLMGNNQY